MSPKFDAEVLVMNRVLKLVLPLEPAARVRVVRMVYERCGGLLDGEPRPLAVPPTLPLKCPHGHALGTGCLECEYGEHWPEAAVQAMAP